MLRIVAKSKIQRPRLTDKHLRYEGSIAVDPKLLELADISEGEMVQVVNVNNGARFETYTIKGKPGEVCLNGAAARLGEVGDEVIIISYCLLDARELAGHRLCLVRVDDRNRPVGSSRNPLRKTNRS